MCNPLIPVAARITNIITETADTKTFYVTGLDGKKPFNHLPGQCAMLGIPGVGEAMFSISSSPTNTEYYEFSIKAVGVLTNHLHTLLPGAALTLRGPYGTPFPVDDVLRGQNLLFIAGGIGIAPMRSVIRYVLDKRVDYGGVDIVYGARSQADLVYLNEMENQWGNAPETKVFLTIDKPDDEWNGHIGFVPAYLSEIGFDNNRTALICGPPVMIKYAVEALVALGFNKSQIYTTLEMRMKCGIGQCGRCNIGHKMICKDGPVFRCDELALLPEEY